MSKIKITAKELRAIGYPENPVIPVAMNAVEKHYKHHNKEDVMDILKAVLASPLEYKNDAILSVIAEKLLPKEDLSEPEISLNNTGVLFSINF